LAKDIEDDNNILLEIDFIYTFFCLQKPKSSESVRSQLLFPNLKKTLEIITAIEYAILKLNTSDPEIILNVMNTPITKRIFNFKIDT